MKLSRPSWWAFQAKHRNVPKFWWQAFRTRPFPDECESLDQLLDFGKRHKVIGFNRECIRAYIFWKIHQFYDCTSFIETGTFYGHTSAFVNRVFETPVFTSEINRTHHLVSRANLLWTKGITSSLSNSTDFVRELVHEPSIGANPMFYLDAHFYENMPLPEELISIGESCEKAVILIDDFLVPWETRFLYDEYPGIRIDMDLVKNTLMTKRTDLSVYLPKYDPEQDPTGKGIGFAVILMGQEEDLAAEQFPFDLLSKVET